MVARGPGLETATSRLQVRRPNLYATTPHFGYFEKNDVIADVIGNFQLGSIAEFGQQLQCNTCIKFYAFT